MVRSWYSQRLPVLAVLAVAVAGQTGMGGEMMAQHSDAAQPGPAQQAPPSAAFQEFHIDRLRREAVAGGQAWMEFLRVPSLFAGLYRLPAGGTDRQQPHAADEIYYVLEGRSRFTAAGEETSVTPGTVLYVKAGVEHRFHTIEEDLLVLVFFASEPPVAP